MALRGAEQIIFLDFILILLLTQYGVATQSPNLSNLQSLPSPKLSPLPDSTKCAAWDWVCTAIGSNGIAQATAYIGWAIFNLPVLFGYIIATTITYLSVTEGIVFSPEFSTNGIPFIGYFFNALQLIVAMEVIRIFRGSSSGF